MHRWLRWPSILSVLYAAGDHDGHRSARVMRAQRELGALQTGGSIDAEGEFAYSGSGLENPDSSFSGLQCDEMPSGFCCGLSPKKIRIDTGDEKCACEGPEGGGQFATQQSIDKYCNEVIQPCKQLSHVICCDMSPKMIRHHDGNDQCWCSGPQPNTTYSTQAAINEWCGAVIKPCAAVSEGHCCQMSPKQMRQGAGDKCWCSGPALGTRFPSQAHIDQACSEVVKPCSEITRTDCCSLSPKQIRYNDGRDGCWCSGPVDGEAYSTQVMLDEWCAKAMAITTTTSTATSHVTTTQSTTTTLATVPCDELSEAMCCAMSPKRTVERLPGDRCLCASANLTGKFQTQRAIDENCADLVRPCASFRQEDCCQASPQKYLVGDDGGSQIAVGTGTAKICTCAGPLKGSRYTQQQAIDEACSRFFTPCSKLEKVSCCLSSPAQFRDGSGERCFCSGPSRGSVTQQDIDEQCSNEIQSCDNLSATACCTKSPQEVRVSNGAGHCWCSGPFVNGNVSHSQTMINSLCSSAVPQTLQMS